MDCFSYTAMARIIYVQMFAWAFAALASPSTLEMMMGVTAGSFTSNAMLVQILGQCALLIGLLMVAVALMSDADSQRKCLQYVSLSPLMATGAMMYHSALFEDTALYINLAQNILTFGLLMTCLYYCNEPGYVLSSDNSTMIWNLRLNYFFQLSYAMAWIAVPDVLYTMSGMTMPTDLDTFNMLTSFIAVCMATAGLILIAGAQIDEDAQKHMSQYAMGAWLYFPIAMGYTGMGLMMFANDPMSVKFYLVLCMSFISLGLYCCYPTTTRTWILRAMYMMQAVTAVWLFTAPEFAWKVWGMGTEYSAASWLVGLNLAQLSCILMAVAQCHEDTQKKVLQYSMCVYPIMCYLAYTGVQMGDLLTVNTAFCTAIVYDLYGLSWMTDMIKMPSLSSSSKSVSKSMSKAPMRKRSATPASRSKK